MHKRRLGRTGLEITEVGYGSWGIGGSQWIGASDDESVKALHRAIDLGLNFIDTALVYGPHHSERLVGEVVRERDEHIFVASKIPPKNLTWPAPSGIPVDEAFPGEHIRRCTERSLENTGLDVIDVMQLHVWDDGWTGAGDWLATIEQLKDEGKIRFFGISVNDRQPANALKLIETGVVDTVQVIYNIFEQAPEDELLPACERHDVGVLARVPFDEGGLTGTLTKDTTFPEGDFRNAYFADGRLEETVDRAQAIVDDLQRPLSDLPELALRYILSHPAVSTVIPGMRSLRNVERNVAVADGQGLPADTVAKLKAHRWDRSR